MKPVSFVLGVALATSLAVVGCAQDAGTAGADGPGVSVDIAALNLSRVGDVVWDIEVDNGGGDVVWQRRITSSADGASAGSASYVGARAMASREMREGDETGPVDSSSGRRPEHD